VSKGSDFIKIYNKNDTKCNDGTSNKPNNYRADIAKSQFKSIQHIFKKMNYTDKKVPCTRIPLFTELFVV